MNFATIFVALKVDLIALDICDFFSCFQSHFAARYYRVIYFADRQIVCAGSDPINAFGPIEVRKFSKIIDFGFGEYQSAAPPVTKINLECAPQVNTAFI